MQRLRNYRINQEIREQHAEIAIQHDDLILPFFIMDGKNLKREIPSLSGVYHYSIDELTIELTEVLKAGIKKVMLFGVIDEKLKNEWATAAYTSGNIVERAVKNIKEAFPEITVFTDVCLCGYTSHGHCGIINGEQIDNDHTLPLLAKIALNHAQAGADFVCPSAMMDGQVEAIRNVLDDNKFHNVQILSYSAKYASNMYGPFRDAAQSSPSFGDRKTYQMDYRTIRQGLEEASADIEEQADWIMVKPAHTYLDMIARIKQNFPHKKLAAYHVSGEYMLLKAAAKQKLINEELAMAEVLTAIKRAGADYIISYYAKQMAKRISKEKLNQKQLKSINI